MAEQKKKYTASDITWVLLVLGVIIFLPSLSFQYYDVVIRPIGKPEIIRDVMEFKRKDINADVDVTEVIEKHIHKNDNADEAIAKLKQWGFSVSEIKNKTEFASDRLESAYFSTYLLRSGIVSGQELVVSFGVVDSKVKELRANVYYRGL